MLIFQGVLSMQFKWKQPSSRTILIYLGSTPSPRMQSWANKGLAWEFWSLKVFSMPSWWWWWYPGWWAPSGWIRGDRITPVYKPWSSLIWKGAHNPILRGRKRSPWLLTTYKSWDDPPSIPFKYIKQTYSGTNIVPAKIIGPLMEGLKPILSRGPCTGPQNCHWRGQGS